MNKENRQSGPIRLLVVGTSVDTAIALLKNAFDKGALSVSDLWWFPPREERLRILLCDPITADQAQALRDVIFDQVHLDEPIRWLDKNPELSWLQFRNMRDRIIERRVAERAEYERLAITRQREWKAKVALMPAKLPKPTPACPQCNRDDHVVPLVYGLPGEETMELGRRRTVVLGGCIIQAENWFCKECKKRFE